MASHRRRRTWLPFGSSIAIVAILYFFQRPYWTLGLPEEFFDPRPGIGSLFNVPPSAGMLCAAHWSLMAVLGCLLIGWKTPLASIAATALMMLNNSFVYSWGKVDHDILLVLTPAALALSGWGSAWSIDAKRCDPFQRPWCLAMLALTLAIGMFTAGWPKLQTNWLDLNTQAVRQTTYIWQQSYGADVLLTGLMLDYMPLWFWESEDWLTVFVELGFFLAIWNLRTLRWALALLMLFHLGILLTLDIPFIGNVLTYGAFFPMARAIRTVWIWLPACLVATLLACPFHSWQETVNQIVAWRDSGWRGGGRLVSISSGDSRRGRRRYNRAKG
jgi:uncharacterized membrane protein YphA (DoxX/SURF4 family)